MDQLLSLPPLTLSCCARPLALGLTLSPCCTTLTSPTSQRVFGISKVFRGRPTPTSIST